MVSLRVEKESVLYVFLSLAISQRKEVMFRSTLAVGCSSAATELSLASVQSTVKLTEQMESSSAPSASRISLTGISSSSR